MRLRHLFALAAGAAAAACSSVSESVPGDWREVPQSARIAHVELDSNGRVVTLPTAPVATPLVSTIRIERDAIGPRLVNGSRTLTEQFVAIDSFDISAERGEVAFSARRDDDFDIGLVATEGSPIKWVPNDPADEIGVQWAPRGNKISYIVRGAGGDLVRTVHIPTGFAISIPLAHSRVHALGWDPQAERFAIAFSTPVSSDQVDVVTYEGKERRVAVGPSSTIDADAEPFAGGAVILRPRDIRYGERLPVVVWAGDDQRWNDARAALMKRSRVAMIVTAGTPGEAVWTEVARTPWMDGATVFVVDPSGRTPRAPGRFLIAGDAQLGAWELRRTSAGAAVSPAVVQSFAAGFIADELKRAPSTHGRSR